MVDSCRKKIINVIYNSAYYYDKHYDIYDNIFYHISTTEDFNKKFFDETFYSVWVKRKINEVKEKNFNKKIKNSVQINIVRIKKILIIIKVLMKLIQIIKMKSIYSVKKI